MLGVVSYRVRCAGGVAFIEVGPGAITPSVLRQVRADAVESASAQARIILADYRASAWLVQEGELSDFYADERAAGKIPAAIVVSPAYERLFRAHAWRVAQVGVLRKVYTDYGRAGAWVQGALARINQPRTVP